MVDIFNIWKAIQHYSEDHMNMFSLYNVWNVSHVALPHWPFGDLNGILDKSFLR